MVLSFDDVSFIVMLSFVRSFGLKGSLFFSNCSGVWFVR